MFERFTDRARQVVVLAQDQARLLRHQQIGTEHLLLGIIEEGEGLACSALTSLGIELETARRMVEEIVGEGSEEPAGDVPFTPPAKKVLELSLREAISLGHNYIGTEHILLGLIREREGVAGQVLLRLGAEHEAARERVVELVSGIELTPSRIPGEEGEARPRRSMLRSSFRGEQAHDPTTWPSCPRCRSPLAETARYRVLDVAPHEESAETRAVPFAFCSRCGVWLGTIG